MIEHRDTQTLAHLLCVISSSCIESAELSSCFSAALTGGQQAHTTDADFVPLADKAL